MSETAPDRWSAEFWDERYAASHRIWSGQPNARLVEHAAGLAPGTALDVGCGEGADAVWLARRGWQVTGVDVSAVALERAAQHAAEAEGVTERCTWRQVDLLAADEVPAADLVSVHFLHLPEQHFAQVYAVLAAAVRPGGTLLVGAHHPADAAAGLRNPELGRLLFAPEQVTALLDPADWDVRVADAPTRRVRDAAGREAVATDTVVVAVRRREPSAG
ncbi:methyltransferase domain-containing protein [Nocardioides sp. dk4132]|uniref:SAM-dependent methyltransferase n=1 Tax=unclassified Nocardioides TaxID=2615069 RepID=UPI0012974641|nr:MULTISPECIES: class I SAM-dependent methyltransferase [unclassified Nocardioides]MQW75859.1 methyltransferase domain-containing protein [Nocardioides sp. dk4132]QGA08727.1 methyltransferase domain-containing protein [Nocardioides sp. dk884]